MAKPAPMDTDKIKGLVCRECGKEYPAVSLHVCDMCFGPLEVQYNYKAIKPRLSGRSRSWVNSLHSRAGCPLGLPA